MSYDTYSIRTLKLIRQRYHRETEQYIRLTELIQLAKYRLKHGEAAYKQLINQRTEPVCEDSVKYEQLNLF